jgi:hypothetical protein
MLKKFGRKVNLEESIKFLRDPVSTPIRPLATGANPDLVSSVCPFSPALDENIRRLHEAIDSFDHNKISVPQLLGSDFISSSISKEDRYSIYPLVLKIFAGKLAEAESEISEVYLTRQTSKDRLVNLLYSSLKPSEINQALAKSTRRIGLALDSSLEELKKKYPDGSCSRYYGSDKGHGSLAATISGAIGSSHTTAEKLLKRILEHLLSTNKMGIEDYRKFVKGGIELIDEVSSLNAKDEKKVIPPMGIEPTCEFVFHDDGKIEIPRKIKDTFINERLGFCPAKMVRLDVNVYGKVRKLDLPQVAFFLGALELEKLIFSADKLED